MISWSLCWMLCLASYFFNEARNMSFARRIDTQEDAAIEVNLETASPGVVLGGLSDEGQLGSGVYSIGDVNGDGYADIMALGSSGDSGSIPTLYLAYGSADSSNVDVTTLSGSTGITITGEFIQLGDFLEPQTSCSEAGDVNGDGFDDFMIGLSGTGNVTGSLHNGTVYVVFGNATMESFSLDDFTASQGFTISGIRTYGGANDRVFLSVGAAGDVNADGYADVIVGGMNGVAVIVFGSESPQCVHFHDKLDYTLQDCIDPLTVAPTFAPTPARRALFATAGATRAPFVINGPLSFGSSVSGIEDIDGDGLDDIVIGCPTCDYTAGDVYVIYGKAAIPSNNPLKISKLTTAQGFIIHGKGKAAGSSIGDATGYVVAGIGDCNGDSRPDILIGAPFINSVAGGAYVVFGQETNVDIYLSRMTALQGIVMFGENAGDFFGYDVAKAGDVNGDGYSDYMVSAPYGSEVGAVFVFYGGEDMPRIIHVSSLDISEGFAVLGPTDGDTEQPLNGWSIAGGFDVNRDGFADIITGSPRNSPPTGSDAGNAYIVYGKETQTSNINLFSLTTVNILESKTKSPITVNVLGNIGVNTTKLKSKSKSKSTYYLSVIIGAPNFNSNGGLVYVILGDSFDFRYIESLTEQIDEVETLVSEKMWIYSGDSNAYCGSSVGSAGDVNGDGYEDFLVGCTGTFSLDMSSLFYYYGSVYVLYGGSSMSTSFSSVSLSSLTSAQGFQIKGPPNVYCNFGASASGAGDFNGDGYADVVIGMPWAFNLEGGAVVFLGGANPSATSTSFGADAYPYGYVVILGNSSQAFLGTSVSSAGDVNGDGVADIILGAPYENSFSGAAYIIFGKKTYTSGSTTTIYLHDMSSDVGIKLSASGIYEIAGTSVSGANDVNADGFSDVIIGGPNGNAFTGVAYIVFGSASPTDVDLSSLVANGLGIIIEGASAGDSLGSSVSKAEDFNQDGIPDVVIGATGAGFSSGGAYIIYGSRISQVISVTSLISSQGVIYTGSTFNQNVGYSVAAGADSLGNTVALFGSNPSQNPITPKVSPVGTAYLVVPGLATTLAALAPTPFPTAGPTTAPTQKPSASPTVAPTVFPSAAPSLSPTMSPSAMPTVCPSATPSAAPTTTPSACPSAEPSTCPSAFPSANPSPSPSANPTAEPSAAPSAEPSARPSADPSSAPSGVPTTFPSAVPSCVPSAEPSPAPTAAPTNFPTATPTVFPSAAPSANPTAAPSANPSTHPTVSPTVVPSTVPTPTPTVFPTALPSAAPSQQPTIFPTPAPTEVPTTLWQAQGSTILGILIPAAGVTIPLCFSKQICNYYLNKYGVTNLDDDNKEQIMLISEISARVNDAAIPWYAEMFRSPCDLMYGSEFKSEKLLEKDFYERYSTSKKLSKGDVEMAGSEKPDSSGYAALKQVYGEELDPETYHYLELSASTDYVEQDEQSRAAESVDATNLPQNNRPARPAPKPGAVAPHNPTSPKSFPRRQVPGQNIATVNCLHSIQYDNTHLSQLLLRVASPSLGGLSASHWTDDARNTILDFSSAGIVLVESMPLIASVLVLFFPNWQLPSVLVESKLSIWLLHLTFTVIMYLLDVEYFQKTRAKTESTTLSASSRWRAGLVRTALFGSSFLHRYSIACVAESFEFLRDSNIRLAMLFGTYFLMTMCFMTLGLGLKGLVGSARSTKQTFIANAFRVITQGAVFALWNMNEGSLMIDVFFCVVSFCQMLFILSLPGCVLMGLKGQCMVFLIFSSGF